MSLMPRSSWFRKVRYLVLLALMNTTCSLALATPVATVETADGTVFVTRTTGKRAILANGSGLEVGDTITTERESYARLRFIDGGEMSVRPSSALVIQSYQFDTQKPEQDNAVLRLLKGGLRTITGLISKRGNQDAYRLHGTTATIGIRGTEFIARVCNNDCASPTASDNKKKTVPTNSTPNTLVARLAESKGKNFVSASEGGRQPLVVGAPLYVSNKIDVDPLGHAVLVFSDETRLVLNGGSQYVLTNVRYSPKQPEKGNMVTDLFKGSLRMVTGLLGKIRPEKVEVRTVVATIGIRGTNFDVVCATTGSQARGDDPVAGGAVQCDQALYAQTRDGTIEVKSGQHRLLVAKGETAYVDSPGAIPTLLAESPAFMKDIPSPKPETLTVDMNQLFGFPASGHDQQGFYAEVKEGRISLSQANGQSMIINAGETGFAGSGSGEFYKLNGSPEFIDSDVWLRDMRVDPSACRAQ
jgi:hypothetical protein